MQRSCEKKGAKKEKGRKATPLKLFKSKAATALQPCIKGKKGAKKINVAKQHQLKALLQLRCSQTGKKQKQ